MAIIYDRKSETIRRELFKIYHEVVDPMNDGFTQWENKKALIDVKYILDSMLSSTNKFGSLEEDYIKQQEQAKLVGILKQ